MLDFLYTQTYDLPTSSLTEEMDEDGDDESLNNLVALYALGDKYAISSLCQHAALDFEENVHDPEQTLLSSIPQLYSSIPENNRMLRDLFLKEIIYHHRYNSTAKMDAWVETLLVSSFRGSFTLLHFGMQAILGDPGIQDLDRCQSRFHVHCQVVRSDKPTFNITSCTFIAIYIADILTSKIYCRKPWKKIRSFGRI